MTKISVFIESKTGEVLGEVFSFKDRISIGSSDECSICLKNIKLAELEHEIYFLNGECWLQVGKDGAPVTSIGKQHRSIKITQSSQFQFRDLVLKIILDSIPEFESEATKIVNEAMLENSDKTRIVSQSEPTLEVVLSAADLTDSEATRVVSDFEQTKIISAQDATRALRVNESVSPALDESTLTNTKIQVKKNKPNFEIRAAEKSIPSQIQHFLDGQDFGRVKLHVQELLNQFQIKERIFPILGVIFIAIAGLMIATRENTASSTEILPISQKKADKLPASLNSAPGSSGAAVTEVPTSQTKDGYLTEMSRLFE